MNIHVQKATISSLIVQRNALLALTSILCIAVTTLSFFLFFKRERIVLLPVVGDREFWVDTNAVSPTYLEQAGVFLANLLFSKSQYSSPAQRSIILRHTEPKAVGAIKSRLIEEESLLAKQNISYTFFPTNVNVNTELLSVELTGDRVAMVGDNKVSSQRETYTLYFNYDGSRLLLSGVEAKEKAPA